MSQPFWTNREHHYGAFHAADQRHLRYLPELLIVLVHGWHGHHERTWGALAELMLRGMDCDADVLSFRYPTWPWFRTSVRQAARDLAMALSVPPLYQHYVFVTHSTGGLVVKELFRTEFRRLGLLGGAPETRLNRTISFRTPLVLNVAVPHDGASRVARRVGKPVFRAFSAVYSPIGPMLNHITGGRYGLGYNSLIPTLVDDVAKLEDKSDRLSVLEEDYLNGIRVLDDAGLPRPRSIEILAGNEIVIEKYGLTKAPAGKLDAPLSRSDMEQLGTSSAKPYVLRGTHQSVKLPRSVAHPTPMVALAVSQVLHLGSRQAVVIARGTLDRVQELNRKAETRTLIGAAAGADLSAPEADQQTAVDRLIQALVKQSGTRPVLLTGAAGVGKSTVLRTLASMLATHFLSGTPAAPLPVFLPLQQFTIESAEESEAWDKTEQGASPWMVLARKWTDWVGRLVADMMDRGQWSPQRKEAAPHVTPEWLNGWMSHQPVTLILDAMDEFLLNNPELTLGDVQLLLDDLSRRFGQNPGLSVIVGLRTGRTPLRSALGELSGVVEIRRPTLDEAVTIAPDVAAWATKADDAEFMKILLTPLIFVRLPKPAAGGLTPDRVRSKSDLLEIALTTLVRNSGLSQVYTPEGQPLTTEACLAAMELMAWRMYENLARETSAKEMATGVKADIDGWQHHVDRHGQRDLESALIGFRALTDEALVEHILARTAFVSTGGDRYRFAHREWESLLLARYLERCIKTRNYGELRHHAIRRDIFRLAAQRLGKVSFDQQDVDDVLRAGQELGSAYVSGNFFAFVSVNPLAELDGPAINIMLAALQQAPPLIACTLLNGFANRALSAFTHDRTGRRIAVELAESLPEFILRRPHDPITASAAWCFRVALDRSSIAPSAGAFEAYAPLSPEEERLALAFICDTTVTPFRYTKDQRSFQRAFLELAGAMRAEPTVRVISGVHYLYYLALASRHGALAESTAELDRMLAEDSDESRIVGGYSVVPEARSIFDRCQALNREALGISGPVTKAPASDTIT